MSHIFKTALLSLAGLAISTAANAGCSDGAYCQNGNAYAGYTYGSSYNTGSTRYISTPNYTSRYSGVMSDAQASAQYGSGSISESYTDSSIQTHRFYGSVSAISGLGTNESLQSTQCPTAVYNPEGGQVLGCYNVVKPVAQTQYYRIVRPVIYVRYPVPVAAPCYSHCAPVKHFSRYGYSHPQHCGHYCR